MTILEILVRNPVKVAVGVLLLVLFGLDSLTRLPMQLTPEVEQPQVSVETRWRGASPHEIEREIIQEQEEQLKSVEGLTRLSSESMDSEGEVTLEFSVGTDMREALVKVSNRLEQVPEYPADADKPVISTSDLNDRSIAWFILSPRMPPDDQIAAFRQAHGELSEELDYVLAGHSLGVRLLRLRRLAAEHPAAETLVPKVDLTRFRRFTEDYIESRFERVPGVADARVSGGYEDELQVIVDPVLLAARQLSIEDVRRALSRQNKDTSGGDFWEGKRRYVVRTLNQFETPEEVARQIVSVGDGGVVYVSDVAEVRHGYKKPDGLVRRFGDSSISISIRREMGSNVLDVMKGLRSAARELNEGVLQQHDIFLTQSYDETDYIYSAIGLVNQNIVVGGLLTIGVLLLFLRSSRPTLIIGFAIPISIVGTFLILDLLGRTLNVISLAGLAFAVGMLVDNAVVVLENVVRHHQRGASPVQAAVQGAREVWGAVAASTLTTLAVFVPVLFVKEEVGQLFGDIALAISAAIAISLLVSVLVIPTAAARILERSARAQPPGADRGVRRGMLARVDRLAGRFVHGVLALNAWVQSSMLRRLATVGVLVGLTALLTYLLWPKVEYLPTGNRNLVFANVLPPPGYNFDKLMQLGQVFEDTLQPYWSVDPNSPEARQLDYPPVEDFFFFARGRRVFMGARSAYPTQAGKYIDLLKGVGKVLPGTIVTARQSSLLESGSDAGRNIDIEITGPDLDRLVQIGGHVVGRLTGEQIIPDAQIRPIPSLDLQHPEVRISPKTLHTAELGIDATELGYTIDALVDGAYAADYFIAGDKVDLRIIGREQFAGRTQDLYSLPVNTPSGHLVPLGSLADIQYAGGPEQINRRERQRAVTIRVTPPLSIPLEEAVDRVNEQIVAPLTSDGSLGAGYAINLSGTADKLRDTWRALSKSFWMALLITYLLMAALFESWVYPLIIILSVPLGLVGGIAGLNLLNVYLGLTDQAPQALDVLTMLGFVILVGTVVNNAILIVHQSLIHVRHEDMAPKDAILASIQSRIRPIFMTTTTTVLGLCPLVLFPGAGSELYRGLGSVVLGGLLVSTIFTLVLVPTLLSLMIDLKAVVLKKSTA